MERAVRKLLTTFILTVIGITMYAQPVLVSELPRNSERFVKVADLVYFSSRDTLWRTDGTKAGTIPLKNGFTRVRQLQEFNGMAIFTNSDPEEIWRSDGTPEGTVLLKNMEGVNDFYFYGDFGPNLFFRGYHPATGYELYRTDGTISGTRLVRDLNPGPAHGFTNIGAAIVGNSLFFGGNDGQHGTELWKTDGTAAGTTMIKDVNPGAGYGVGAWNVLSYNNKFYFFGNTPEHGEDPWVSDGTSEGTMLLRDIEPGARTIFHREYNIAHNGQVYFSTYSDTRTIIWKTRGTPASTSELTSHFDDDFFHSFSDFFVFDDRLYFFDHSNGELELWYTDGAHDGTVSVFARPFVNGYVTFLEAINDHILFHLNVQGGYDDKFYRSAGTPGSTETFDFIVSSSEYGPRDPTKVNELVFYADHNQEATTGVAKDDYFELKQSDGFTTRAVSDLYGGSYAGTREIVDYFGNVLFMTYNDHPESNDRTKRLYIYDPTPPEGRLSVETWNGISGTQVSSIPVHLTPSSVSEITIFETPKNIGDNYGSRVRGYVIPPVTGNYTFWISSDDRSELWLSTDDTPANKRRIAYVGGWTNSRQWDKYPSQKSPAVSLVAGRKYFVEALLKEGTGADHLAVGWQLPNGTLERPIPGQRLMAFGDSPSNAPVVAITSPEEGATFTAPANITISADASLTRGTISKVEFYSGASKLGEDTTSPYSFTWTNVPEGNYTLTVIAIDTESDRGSDNVNITVRPGSACTGTGRISVETWTGIDGTRVSSIPVSSPPNLSGERNIFEASTNIGSNFGSRFRGYVCVPTSGNYTFWIASDDHSELWLSTDNDPANKRRIAYHTGWTFPRQWTKYTTQQSAPISLVAGQQYYIEALYKEDEGGDNLAVGWQLPDGTLERPIPGNRLSPFNDASSTTAARVITEEELYSQINVYPNPVKSGDPQLTISGYEGVEKTLETQIEILNMTGEVVFGDRISCGGGCGSYLMNINKQLVPGVYLVRMITDGVTSVKRLMVK